MVGFYNPNIDFEEDKEINNKNKTNINNNNDNKDADKTTLIIIFSILGSVFVALLMFLSFYFGMKIKEGRKKRANELKEDNYEYYQEESKDENKLIN
jgi:flagellar basal body-associated protein FliL